MDFNATVRKFEAEMENKVIGWKIEILDNNSSRYKVIGGWVVETQLGICFVPDQFHVWKVE